MFPCSQTLLWFYFSFYTRLWQPSFWVQLICVFVLHQLWRLSEAFLLAKHCGCHGWGEMGVQKAPDLRDIDWIAREVAAKANWTICLRPNHKLFRLPGRKLLYIGICLPSEGSVRMPSSGFGCVLVVCWLVHVTSSCKSGAQVCCDLSVCF